MSDDEGEMIELLRRIERNQQEQLARQQQQLEMSRRQFERAERIQDRAEHLQDSSAAMIGTARKALVVILPIVIFLIVYLSWLILR